MLKIEFDENNTLVVSAISQMLSVISGEGLTLTDERSVTTTEPVFEAPHPITEDLTPPSLDDDLDTELYPWDARIHARTKTKNADGTWKFLRRPVKDFPTVDEWQAFIDSVKSELKMDDTTVATDDEIVPNTFGETNTDTPAEDVTFMMLMKTVTASNDKVTPEDLQEICDAYEIAKPSDLNKPANKVWLPAIYDEVLAIINE